MWVSRLKEVRQRRNRWQIEGIIVDPEADEEMSFSITVRFGWLAFEGVAGPLFNRVLTHLNETLGEPAQPPTCSGASECQDDSVHLTTSWEIGEQHPAVEALLAQVLCVPEGSLAAS